MTSWQIIKEHFTKGKTAGTFEYDKAVILASRLFFDLWKNEFLADDEKARVEFDDDPESKEAFILKIKNSGGPLWNF